MFTRICSKCRASFPLADARIDDHRSAWSWQAAYCYCPCCGARLDGVHPDSVDLAKHLTPTVLAWAVLGLLVGATGVVGTLGYVGPLMVGAFGLWLGLRAQLRDHRVIGWLLMAVAVGTLWFADHAG